VLSWSDGAVTESQLPTKDEVTAVALDPLGRIWAATRGALWTYDAGFRSVWTDASFTSPFVGLFADVGRVIAVTSDGAIVHAEQTMGMKAR
jgi:hypothetical protein